MKIVKFLKAQGIYLVISLIFAIALFIYVGNSNQATQQAKDNQSSGTFTTLTSQRKVKVTMPLQVNVDTSKYFVTGAPSTVTVQLTGSSALVTAVANTKNFEISANLKNLSLGKHRVQLKVSGLDKTVAAKVIPSKINVEIAQRASKIFNVNVNYNKESIASGYEVTQTNSSVQNVQVTGAKDQVDQVTQIIAPLNLNVDTRRSVQQQVKLEAINANGKLLDVVLSPQTTQVNLNIKAGQGQKTVPVVLKAQGKDNGDYELTANVNEVVLSGQQTILNKINNIQTTVDVDGITKTTVKTIKIDSLEGISKISPRKLKVTITPSGKNGDTSQTSKATSTKDTAVVNSRTSSSSSTDK